MTFPSSLALYVQSVRASYPKVKQTPTNALLNTSLLLVSFSIVCIKNKNKNKKKFGQDSIGLEEIPDIHPDESMAETQPVTRSPPQISSQTHEQVRAPSQAHTNVATQAHDQAQPQADQGVSADDSQPITLDQLRAALSSARAQHSSEEILRQRERLATTPTPLDLLNLELLQPIINDPQAQTLLGDVVRQHAPPNDASIESLPDILRSPALRAHAAALSEALRSDQGWEVLRSFGVPADPSHAPDALTAFIEELLRLQRQHRDGQQD